MPIPRFRITLGLVVLSILLVALAAAAEEKKQVGARATAQQAQVPVAVSYSFGCVVQGTPVEFPDDIRIKNLGTQAVPKGTTLRWSIPNTNRAGNHVLTADLAPEAMITLSGVVSGGTAAGAACDVTVIQPATKSAISRKLTKATARPIDAKLLVALDCVAQGTPVEFPDDVYITNSGAATIAKGTTLHWAFPNTNRAGDYTLTEDLAAGKGVLVSGAVPGGVGAGTKCTAQKK